MFNPNANNVFADGPSGMPQQPAKSEVRKLLRQYEDAMAAGLSNGGMIYDTKASMSADLIHAANSSAWVISDPVAANNGIYRKTGASDAGSWTRVADLPYSFIRLNDAGAGTANAIIATSSIPLPGAASAALLVMNVFEANTGPVTIAANGAPPKSLKSNSGSDLAAGYLSAGMMAVFLDDGANFRLLSDVASAAIQAAAEAAAASAGSSAQIAEDARDAAVASAAALATFVVNSTESAATINLAGYSQILVNRFLNTSHLAPAFYEKVAQPANVQPTHIWKFQSSDGAWWSIVFDQVNALSFGVRLDLADGNTAEIAANTVRIQKLADLNKRVLFPAGKFLINDQINFSRDTKFIGSGSWDGLSSKTSSAGAHQYPSHYRPESMTIIRYVGAYDHGKAVINISWRSDIELDVTYPAPVGNWVDGRENAGLEDLVIDCAYKAGVGVFAFQCGSATRIQNVCVVAAARFGWLAGNIWTTLWSNLRALWCRTGFSFGDQQWNTSAVETAPWSITANTFSNFWAYKCGWSDLGLLGQNAGDRAYFNDAAAASIREGAGMYLRLDTCNTLLNFVSEYNDGPGYVYDGRGTGNEIHGLWGEQNCQTAFTVGRAARPWGLYIRNAIEGSVTSAPHKVEIWGGSFYQQAIKITNAPGVTREARRVIFHGLNINGTNAAIDSDILEYELRDQPAGSLAVTIANLAPRSTQRETWQSETFIQSYNATGVPKTMRSFPFPPNKLLRPPQEMTIEVFGTIVGTAGAKTIRLTETTAGSLGDIALLAATVGRFRLKWTIMPTAIGAQKVYVEGFVGTTVVSAFSNAAVGLTVDTTWNIVAQALTSTDTIEIDRVKVETYT